MKNIVIITGHSHYASGMLSALEMIAGHNDDVMAVDFEDDIDIVSEYQKIISKYRNDNLLVVCDLLGGTPFKEASKLAYPNSNIEVVIGCNLGSLLEIVLLKDKMSLNDLVEKIIESSKKNIVHLEKKNIMKKEEVSNEGI